MYAYGVAWDTWDDCTFTGFVYANSKRESIIKVESFNNNVLGVNSVQVSEGLLTSLNLKFCYDKNTKEAIVFSEITGQVLNSQTVDEEPIIPKELPRIIYQQKNNNKTYNVNRKDINRSLDQLFGLEQQHMGFLDQGIMDIDEFNEIWNNGGPDILEG